jgi:hypothetical protein
MKFLIAFVLLTNLAIAEEETEFDKFVDKKKDEHLSKETQEKLKPSPKTPPKKGETEFDSYVDKKKKEYIHRDLKPKKDEGLIDPLIDGAKEATESGKKKIEEVTGPIKRSMDLRDDSFGTVAVGYQLFTTWIPSKWTASYTQNLSRYWAIEGEYSKGSLSLPVVGFDIGEVTEQRATVQARYFPGNSFNWSFGLLYQKGKAELGGDIPAVGSYEFFEMENFGATLGFGNRWQWENGITLGIDWFRVNQPLFGKWENDGVVKKLNSDDASDVKKIIRAFNTLPTFVLLGFQIGYTF